VLNPAPTSPLAGPVAQYLIGNLDVCGAAIFVSWQQVDRGPGAKPRYDWSTVQSAMAPWEAAGKTVNLIVWGASEGGMVQRSTPAWVQSRMERGRVSDGVACLRSPANRLRGLPPRQPSTDGRPQHL
jgi:hypothetical protein